MTRFTDDGLCFGISPKKPSAHWIQNYKQDKRNEGGSRVWGAQFSGTYFCVAPQLDLVLPE